MTLSQPMEPNKQLRALDDALAHYIERAEAGHNDQYELYNIEKQITALTFNPQIPESVRENLHSALKEFQQIQAGHVNLDHLYNLKAQLDHALGHSKEPGIEKKEKGTLD